MVQEAELQDLMRRNGCLYVYGRDGDFAASESGLALRAELGHQQVLTAGEVAALEPRLAAFEAKGLFFPDSINVSDPRAVMARLGQPPPAGALNSCARA